MSLEKRIGHPESRRFETAHGFSLIEMMMVILILGIVLGSVVKYATLATQRSKAEQTKVDLTQEGREFVDEFERDLHQSGYPGCRMFNTAASCPAHFSDGNKAVGMALVDNRQVIFEGDVDGDGVVDSVQYQVWDSAGNFPPTGTCPCTIRRSQVPKVDTVAPLLQATAFSQELQNVVNSGVPPAGLLYGGGLLISGNVLFGGGAITNDAYYAAVTTFKDFPVFSAYDQNGASITLPRVITTVADQPVLACTPAAPSCIKSIRLTINLLASTTGGDQQTGVRPVVTLVGNGRLNN